MQSNWCNHRQTVSAQANANERMHFIYIFLVQHVACKIEIATVCVYTDCVNALECEMRCLVNRPIILMAHRMSCINSSTMFLNVTLNEQSLLFKGCTGCRRCWGQSYKWQIDAIGPFSLGNNWRLNRLQSDAKELTNRIVCWQWWHSKMYKSKEKNQFRHKINVWLNMKSSIYEQCDTSSRFEILDAQYDDGNECT